MANSILAAALTSSASCSRRANLLPETNIAEQVVEQQDLKPENGSFYVDRSRIQALGEAEQAAELRSLGLSVYDQTALEQGILDQVDRALEEQDRRQLDVAIKAVAADIAACNEQLKKSEALLLKATLAETLTLRNGINIRQKRLKILKAKEQALIKRKRDLLGVGLDEVPEIDDGQGEIEKAAVDLLQGTGKSIETEMERKIRLGEMTPFGTLVGLESNSNINKTKNKESMSEFEKYLQSQQALQQRQKKINKSNKKGSDKPSAEKVKLNEEKGKMNGEKESKTVSPTKKKRSPLKKSVLFPKKHKKKENPLGTSTSSDQGDQYRRPAAVLSERIELEASGSEYLPSSDEGEEGPGPRGQADGKKKKTKKMRKSIESWGTDDSDWESSDEEAIARRRKSSKKSIDDGDLMAYKERMKVWKLEQKTQEVAEETYHELSMGYRVPQLLWEKLYKYQQVGVQWLWELHQQRCGGILGDEMGLGKTIQIIAFLAGLCVSEITDKHMSFRGMGPVLIVCPTTLMHQWVKEFHTWWPPCRVSVLHVSGSHVGKREALIRSLSSRSVLVTSYAGVTQYREVLVARDWQYVVLDEGHKIRNPDAQVTITVKMFRTPHRLILSGSPMQNHLKELWSLFDFIFPGKLGTLPVFLAQLAVPITQGGYANASQTQVATAYRCATVLRNTISPYLLRRLKPDVQAHVCLPPKSEQVLFCRLTEEQKTLYRSYLESGDVDRIIEGRMKVFVGLIHLRKICNHPDIYSGGPKLMKWEDEDKMPEEERYGYWRKAGKMLVIESLLKIWRKQRHRVLLFTQSRQMLCILESFVQKQGYSYMKMDGTTSIGARQPLIRKFNEDPSVFVFLLTTHVGGLGVNLTGADRVVIYDPDWNPATDTQARERAWRIGQLNQVTVYRLVTAGTIEEKIYHRQIFKQFLTNKVLRDPRQRRFFKTNDLFELFTFKDEDDGKSTETAAIFAGTNSEVRVDLKARLKARKSSAMAKALAISKPGPSASSVTFSREKMERMKQLAHALSQKIGGEKKTKKTSERGEMGEEMEEGEIEDADAGALEAQFIASRLEGGDDTADPSSCAIGADETLSSPAQPTPSGVDHGDKLERKGKRHRHKHHKRDRGAKFEGERIPYLVKQRKAKEEKEEEAERTAKDDDYVLKKLFKTPGGLHEVLQHDVIIGEGDPDYALVEGEAKRVAQEAVKALKESRRLCWEADSGVPSWTGQSGTLRSPGKPRFGKKTTAKGTATAPPSSPAGDTMSSRELIDRIQRRNVMTDASEDTNLAVSRENADLLAEIRNFVSYGGAVNHSATTEEILGKFGHALPTGMSPLFKFLLMEVCEFYRLPNKEGMWKLRTEFR